MLYSIEIEKENKAPHINRPGFMEGRLGFTDTNIFLSSINRCSLFESKNIGVNILSEIDIFFSAPSDKDLSPLGGCSIAR